MCLGIMVWNTSASLCNLFTYCVHITCIVSTAYPLRPVCVAHTHNTQTGFQALTAHSEEQARGGGVVERDLMGGPSWVLLGDPFVWILHGGSRKVVFSGDLSWDSSEKSYRGSFTRVLFRHLLHTTPTT